MGNTCWKCLCISKLQDESARFADSYELERGPALGKGGYATVRKARKKNLPLEFVAVKIIDCSKLNEKDLENLQMEVEIMKQLSNHPNITKCFDSFNISNKAGKLLDFMIVLEIMEGGELFDQITRKVHYNETEARVVMSDLFKALEICHKNKIMHRDLKACSVLLFPLLVLCKSLPR